LGQAAGAAGVKAKKRLVHLWCSTAAASLQQTHKQCHIAYFLQVSTYQRRFGLPEEPQHVVQATMAGA